MTSHVAARPHWRRHVTEILERVCTGLDITDPDLRHFCHDVFEDDAFCAACFRSHAFESGGEPTANEPIPLHLMVVVALKARQATILRPQDRQLAAVAGLFYWCGFVHCADPRNRLGTAAEDTRVKHTSLARALLVTGGLMRLERQDAALAATLSRLLGAGEGQRCNVDRLQRLESAVRDHAPDLRAHWTWDF